MRPKPENWKQPLWRRITMPLLLIAAVTIGGAASIQRPIIYENPTASMPEGLYLARSGPAQPGDIVVFPSSVVHSYGLHLPPTLLKRFAYGGGTTVTIDKAGLSENGTLVAPRVANIGLRFNGTLRPGQAIVLGENPDSFDSRYFGPVPRNLLRPVTPLLIW